MDMPTDDRELRVALDGPICPQLLREDAVVTNADGWYKILTPSSAWAADNEILFSRLGERALDAEIDAVLAVLPVVLARARAHAPAAPRQA